jgi:hypothetical protein
MIVRAGSRLMTSVGTSSSVVMMMRLPALTPLLVRPDGAVDLAVPVAVRALNVDKGNIGVESPHQEILFTRKGRTSSATRLP